MHFSTLRLITSFNYAFLIISTVCPGDDAVASNDSHIDMSSHTFCGENESAELGFPMGENQSVVHDISPSSPSFLATQPNISTCEGRGVSGQSDAHDEGKHFPALQLKARSNDVNAVISMACPSSSHTCEGLQLREVQIIPTLS